MLATFKTYVLKSLNVLMFKISGCICAKYHLGVQTICNVTLVLRKKKDSSVISEVVETECSEFMMKRRSRTPLK